VRNPIFGKNRISGRVIGNQMEIHGIKYFRNKIGAEWCTILLLLPVATFGSIYFGLDAFVVLLLSTLITMIAGAIIAWSEGKKVNVFNPGSIVTGLLIGLTLSPQTPFYMIIVGCFIAEFVGKTVFAHFNNHFNPAVVGRTAIAILETYDPIAYADLSTGASALFKEAGGLIPPDYWNALFGFTKGSIGETSALLLIIVGFLMLKYVVIKREAAISMILTVPIVVFLVPDTPEIVGHAPWVSDPLLYLIGGPSFFMAFFFLTSPSTTPNTKMGGILFGVGVGVLSVLGKMYTTIAGVEMYSILIMNFLVPVLDYRKGVFQFKPEKAQAKNYGVTSFYATKTTKSLIELVEFNVPSFAAYNELPQFAEFHKIRAESPAKTTYLQKITASHLCGCGGAFMPVGKKWELAIANTPKYLVVNGSEGEPFTLKDDFLMRNYPHILLEGIAISAWILGIKEVYLVINSAYEMGYDKINLAIDDFNKTFTDSQIRFYVQTVPDLYILGEETALLNYIEGQRGEPRLKPPYPLEKGLFGQPTVINNVETLSWIPLLLNKPDLFKEGQIKLITQLNEVASIQEVRLGTTIDNIIKDKTITAVEIGGVSGGFLPAEYFHTPYENKALSKLGLNIGSGSIRTFSNQADVLEAVVNAVKFLQQASCGRCTPCRVGTQVLDQFVTEQLMTDIDKKALSWISEVSHTMQQTSTCGLGRSASTALLSYLKYF
jgi:NADH:ubiquinone oxidoreductase subunit F (NADH-binding)/Na+-translocating ferredoxin:NAD+ oxidoreductase RnfD subunit